MTTNRFCLFATILICFATILATTNLAIGQTVFPGVSKGETFDYSYSLLWTSTNPSATPPSDLIEYNNTQQIEFTITDVSGSVLTLDFIRHFKNGTQTTQSGTINLENGQITVPYGFLIIASNLAKNQQIYPQGGHQVITDTVTRSYSSGQRETNVISGGDSSSKTTIYFDKVKGIAVEYSYEIDSVSNGNSVVSTESMINTNSDVWATSASASTSTPSPSITASGSTITPNPTSGDVNTFTVPPTSTFGTTFDMSTIVIIGSVIIVVVLVLILALQMVKKRKPRKQKAAAQEEEFDLSGYKLK